MKIFSLYLPLKYDVSPPYPPCFHLCPFVSLIIDNKTGIMRKIKEENEVAIMMICDYNDQIELKCLTIYSGYILKLKLKSNKRFTFNILHG